MDLAVHGADIDRRSPAIARAFAAILFAFAAIIGLPMALALAVSAWTWDWHILPLVAATLSVACGLAWLGRLLWIGRPIPAWFIAAFGVGIVAVPAVALLATGAWMESVATLGLSLPLALQFREVLRADLRKPRGPQALDELA